MAESVPVSQWIERWSHVISSHRPSQLGWRLYKLLQRRCFPLLPKSNYRVDGRPADLRENVGLDRVLQRQLALRLARGDFAQRVEKLLEGEFCFLNQTRSLGPVADQSLNEVEPVSHLWRFHLHYQEFLLDLLAADREETHPQSAHRIWPIIDAWIRSNPLERPGAISDAWHPFCISRRLAVWLLLVRADVIPAESLSRFANSLESQTRFLERNLEWDLRGNHLFENLRTLILVGASLNGARFDRRLEQGIRLLSRQLEEQLTPEGEHFERSPMYHTQMLSAVLDVRDATEALRPDFAAESQIAANRMASFLCGILHPDGQVPLLSDSTLEETPDPGLLLKAANTPSYHQHGSVASQSSGAGSTPYWVWRDGDDFLLFDRGPVGADDLPAHAHNDLLTIEASFGGERLIVDSGVFDYDDSEMRSYCRSTAAHNVLQVDRAEQCDLWSRFRMGRRGHPTGSADGRDGEFRWAAGSHDAYSTIGIPQVGRWIACRPEGPWIVADWADGSGDHEFSVKLHFAPNVTIEQKTDREAALFQQGRSFKLRFLTPGRLLVETDWYCPDFGVRVETPTARFDLQAAAPTMIVWTLAVEGSIGDVTVESGGECAETLIWRTSEEQWQWSPRTLLSESRNDLP